MKLVTTSNAPQVLSLLSKELLGVNAKVRDLTGGFSKLKLAIGGAMSVFAGEKILSSLARIAVKGDDLLDQQNQMLRLGISARDVTAATANYWANVAKAVPTSTVAEYLKTVKELRAVTGDITTAEKFAPAALKFDSLLSNITGTDMHGQLYKLLRAGELKGIATDPEKLNALVTQAYSYIAAFGGKLTPAMIQNLAVRGGTAWQNADLGKSFGPMAVLAAEMGTSGSGGSGSSPGVVLNQLQQLMLGAHTMSKQQAAAFAQLGILDPSKTVATGFGGGSRQLMPGAMKGSSQYAGDVPGWARNVIWPAIVRAAHGDPALEQALLAKIAPNINAQKAIELFGNPEFLKQQEKDIGLSQQVLKQGMAYSSFAKNDPKGVIAGFTDQYNSMLSAIGAPMMQAAMPVMTSITGMFTSIGQFATAHPRAIQEIGEGFAFLGGTLVAGGITALLAMLGPVGWVAALITGLGALAIKFSNIVPIVKAFGEVIAGLFHKLESLLGIGSAPNAPAGALPGFQYFDPTLYTGGGSLSPAMYGSASVASIGRSIASPMGHVSGMPMINGATSAASSGSAMRLMNDLVGKCGWSPEAAAVMAGNVATEFRIQHRLDRRPRYVIRSGTMASEFARHVSWR